MGKFSTYIFRLPVLEPEMAGECFAIDLASIRPSTAKLETLCDYLVDTYIDNYAYFPLEI